MACREQVFDFLFPPQLNKGGSQMRSIVIKATWFAFLFAIGIFIGSQTAIGDIGTNGTCTANLKCSDVASKPNTNCPLGMHGKTYTNCSWINSTDTYTACGGDEN